MKQLVLLMYMFLSLPLFCQIGIGTTSPDNSSALEVNSSNKGFLMPRMTTLERDAIVTPAIGLIIFNLDTNSFNYYLGSTSALNWISILGTHTQVGSLNVGDTVTGWNYFNIIFSNPFKTIPSIELTFREGTGIDNAGSYSASHFKVANASNTGFTIGIYETSVTYDVYIDWMAILKSQ